MVHAGATPIAGASVQLYAAGFAGNGSAPTVLLATPLTTDASGGFSVGAGSYSCPATGSVLYLVASGGNVNAGNTSNSAIELMTVPGVCSNVSSGTTYVLNELTTTASVYALRAFVATGAQLGSTVTNTGGLALATATVASLVNLTTVSVPGAGFSAVGTLPRAKLNTLANLLNTCTASASAASAGCTGLLAGVAATGAPPTNTLDAVLQIANSPGANAGALYTLAVTTRTFTPTLSAAPADWTLPLAFTGGGMSTPTGVSLDSKGNVWVVNYPGVVSLFSNTGLPKLPGGITGYGLNASYSGAVDANDRLWVVNAASDPSINGGNGSVTVLDSSGAALPGTSQYSAGGIYQPIAIAFDGSDNAWVLDNYDGDVVVLNNSGTPLSGSSGYASSEIVFANAIATDSQGNGWAAIFGDRTVIEVAGNGTSFTSYAVGDEPDGVAIDTNDNVWTANYLGSSIGLVSGGKVLSGAGFTGGGVAEPAGIATDGAGTVWIANLLNGAGISELSGAGTEQPGTPLSPATLGWASELNLQESKSIAIDAAGNVWVVCSGDNRLIELVGAATPVQTPLLGATRVP